jgi:hypothetical protein
VDKAVVKAAVKEGSPVASVGIAHAVLKNRATGNKNDAATLLLETNPNELVMRNRSEARSRTRRSMKRYKMGRKVQWQDRRRV